MASKLAVAKAMAVLGATFPRDVTPELVAIYAAAVQDLSDQDLDRAVQRAVATCRFFPVPAELREFAGANRPPVVEVDTILDQLRGMCGYLPTVGTIAPRVDDVRQKLGESVARAYAACGGGSRLLLGNDTTSAIALREFTQELHAEVRAVGPAALLPATSDLRLVQSPNPQTRGLLRD
ncbi:MAG: hypothetical protein C0503_00790 [Gemmatimonas sp.]|nr:hypothetical protein [Gemmatimonas sp.]